MCPMNHGSSRNPHESVFGVYVYPIPSTIVDYQYVLDENYTFGRTDFADVGNRNLSALIDIAAFSLRYYTF